MSMLDMLKKMQEATQKARELCHFSEEENVEIKDEWHNTTNLPPQNEEVIVLDNIGKISFGHIVDPNKAKSYDGWNIPNIKFWRPCNFTEEMKKFLENVK